MVDLKRTADLNIDAVQNHDKCNDIQVERKTAHHIDVKNKVHNDALASDPYWINGVQYEQLVTTKFKWQPGWKYEF
jgi:hypothetical protein